MNRLCKHKSAHPIICEQDGTLYGLNRNLFQKIIFKLQKKKEEEILKFISKNQVKIETVPLFKDRKISELENIAGALQTIIFQRGDLIINEGIKFILM